MATHLRRLAATLLYAGSIGAGEIGTQSPTIEYDVKAAFLLNFSRFVEWPAAQRQQPFTLCTLLPDPFGARLEAAAAGETWEGRPVVVRRMATLEDAECHLLFVPAAAMSELRARGDVIAGRPVLLVGESPDFLEVGGMIRLFLDQNYVRFAVNQETARRAGLRVSSRLMRLARPGAADRGLS